MYHRDRSEQFSPVGPTPIAAIARGLAAGAVGTFAMDALLFTRYRHGGGTDGFQGWEFSSDVHSWEQAPAPAQVGRRLFEGLFELELPDSRARLVNTLTHWGYGILSGAVYGIVAGSFRGPLARSGLAFGTQVWAVSYAVLPAAGLYRPIWEYDSHTLARDLRAHLLYGLATAAAFKGATALEGRRS